MRNVVNYLKSKFLEVVIVILLALVYFQLLEVEKAVWRSDDQLERDVSSIKDDVHEIRWKLR